MADEHVPDGEPEPTHDAEAETAGAGNAEGMGDPYAAPADPYEGAVPLGYDWPTHGGYLGCLIGLVAACLVAGFLGSLVIGLVSVTPLGIVVSTPFARITLLVLAFIVCFGALGRLGWVLGKRFYREYPQPEQGGSASSAGSGDEAGDETQPEPHERVL